MRLTEENLIVYVLKPGDHGAGVAGDSIDMTDYLHATFIVQFAAITDDVGDLTIKSGNADGTQTTSETFYYRLASAVQGATSADQYGAELSSTSLTLVAATYQNRTLICEVNTPELTAGQPFITFAFSADATAINASVVAILKPRYLQYNPPTAIA